MSSLQSLYHLLYEEAQLLFSGEALVELEAGRRAYFYTPSLQRKVSLPRFYVLLNAYFLEQPSALLAYLKHQGETTNFQLYLESLKAISLAFRGNEGEYRHLKELYRAISVLPQVRSTLGRDCSVPEDIARALSFLGQSKDVQVPIRCECRSHSTAYSKVVLLTTRLTLSSDQAQFSQSWGEINEIVGTYGLNPLKIFDLVTSSLVSRQLLQASTFLLRKFSESLGSSRLLKHLLQKLQNEYYSMGNELTYRGRIDVLLSSLEQAAAAPNEETLRVLCVLVKEEIGFESVFPLLTPSLQQLIEVAEMHVDLHQEYARKCFKRSLQAEGEAIEESVWGELIFSSKLEFLNQLLLMNYFQVFKAIISRYSIRLDLLYHPKIFHSLALLFEWIIDPLYRIVGYDRSFPGARKRALSFPQGFFRQCGEVSNCLIDSLVELIEVGKSYLFAKKELFTKVCRIFRDICSKRMQLSYEQSDVSKKIIAFIANVIKRHLLPAIEYYRRDPSVSNELEALMSCFKFKVELDIYLHCLKAQQFSNLHLTLIHKETAEEQVRCLNRLSSDSEAIVKRMSTLMVCHVFSALRDIFSRIVANTHAYLDAIVEALQRAPRFTKKVAMFYVFLHLFEEENALLTPTAEANARYGCLVDFTRKLLLLEAGNEDFVKIILEYIVYKFSLSRELADLKTFDYLHGEIHFLADVLADLLPVELEENCINRNNRISLAVGPLLKMRLMGKMQAFQASSALRKSIVKCLFRTNSNLIFDNYFYFLLLKLSEKLSLLALSQASQQELVASLHDRILALLINLINIAHFEMAAEKVEKYFSTKLFPAMATYYRLPYEVVFYVIRKSITHKLETEDCSLFQEDAWEKLKLEFTEHLRKCFKSKSKNKQYLASLDRYSEEQINDFLNADTFVLFWIQDISYSLYLPGLYDLHLKAIKSEIQACPSEEEAARLKDFHDEMAREEERSSQLNEKVRFDYSSSGERVKSEYYRKYLILQEEPEESLEEKCLDFAKMMIKYCIMPRAMLAKAESYYSWCFYFHLLKHNRFPIQITVKLICLLLESVCAFVPFATYREASELLPLLYNSAFVAVNWSTESKCNEKLHKFQLIREQLTSEEYSQILTLTYESQTRIIQGLTEHRNLSVFSLKNCMHMIFKCKSIPYCLEHQALISHGLAAIRSAYSVNKDVLGMVERLSTQLESRFAQAKEMPVHVLKNCRRISLVDSGSVMINCRDVTFDPMRSYPQISTSIDNEETNEFRAQPKTIEATLPIIEISSDDDAAKAKANRKWKKKRRVPKKGKQSKKR